MNLIMLIPQSRWRILNIMCIFFFIKQMREFILLVHCTLIYLGCSVYIWSDNLYLWRNPKRIMLRHFRFQCNFKVITIIIGSQLCSCIELWLSPDVSEEVPCKSPNRLPPALLIAAILEIIGRLWMTKATSFFCCWARFRAWPMIPKPVMSVAACALNLCIKAAAGERKKTENIWKTI